MERQPSYSEASAKAVEKISRKGLLKAAIGECWPFPDTVQLAREDQYGRRQAGEAGGACNRDRNCSAACDRTRKRSC
jgi:hypothetical protein